MFENVLLNLSTDKYFIFVLFTLIRLWHSDGKIVSCYYPYLGCC